jgi:hypothetical protein
VAGTYRMFGCAIVWLCDCARARMRARACICVCVCARVCVCVWARECALARVCVTLNVIEVSLTPNCLQHKPPVSVIWRLCTNTKKCKVNFFICMP